MVQADVLRPSARIWIYQSTTPFTKEVEAAIRDRLGTFVPQWTAHNRQLMAGFEIYHGRFIVLMVDEAMHQASGCSIDSSVAFVQSLEREFDLSLFDRMSFSYQKDGQVHTVPRQTFSELYRDGEIDDSTLVFDNLVKTKGALETQWLKPLAESWHRRFV